MLGRLDGENAVKQGEGFMIQKLKDYHNNATLQAEFKSAGAYMSHMAKEQAKFFARERRD